MSARTTGTGTGTGTTGTWAAGAGTWSTITGACTGAGACASGEADTRSQTRTFSSSKETLHTSEQNTTSSSWLVTTHAQTTGLWSGFLHSAQRKYSGTTERRAVCAKRPTRVPSHAAHVVSPPAITLSPPSPHDVATDSLWTSRTRGQIERLQPIRLQSVELRRADAPGLLWRRRITEQRREQRRVHQEKIGTSRQHYPITGEQGTHYVGGQHEPRRQHVGGHAHRRQQSRRPPCGGGAAPRDWGVCVLAPLPARHCRQWAARGSLTRRGSRSTVDCVAGGAATRACPCGTPLLREVQDARPGVDRAAGGRTGVSATIVPYAA